MDNHLPIFDKDKCTFFALGRNAMFAVCQILGLQASDEILTPAFDCDGSLQPFRVLGCKFVFFRSNPHSFEIDLDDLRRRITSKTKLIHIINHFGFPQPWNQIMKLRKELDIPILEDNAYSLFSKFEGKLFGTFGDFSIFSLRKNLSIIEGGMLRINNTKYTFKLNKKDNTLFYAHQLFYFLKKIKDRLGFYGTPRILKILLKKISPEIEPPPPLYSSPQETFPEWPLRDLISKEFSIDYLRSISHIAEKQLGKFTLKDYIDIMDKKKHYYLWLSQKIADIDGITILWPKLPEGIVPFCLSVFIESSRDGFLNELRKKYDVMAWPTLSRLVLDRLEDFPEIEIMGRKLLQINLPAEKVRSVKFGVYLDRLVDDLHNLARKYLPKK